MRALSAKLVSVLYRGPVHSALVRSLSRSIIVEMHACRSLTTGGEWVTPAFQFTKSKIDEKPSVLTIKEVSM